ncbi:hypothetical protein [Fischerella thermalis]|uniref:DnaD domain-containing protein n=1 Tax=Fischerella thermalis CCMEE 5318 TaxID=2019666 RepID=A0A2N6L3E2_9CYAN|nr:hypothetical protein [Fischerella thermalis]PMB14587.1 hypothetical protein CEN46_26730 [Fischerella thermalis CCMEE 5318]PMB42878.1 hypothetical protein CEN47_00890 [Fischerella thermalis CCMEE 5319]
MQREQNLALLPQNEIPPFTPSLGTSADLAIALLIHYSFDLSGYQASELVNRWQQQYSDSWLHIAVIEALYQGRYKAISVQQILTLWQRRGQAVFHFNMEFERLICSKFPESLTSVSTWSQFSAYHTPRADEEKKEEVETQRHGDTKIEKHEEISPHLPITSTPKPQRQLLPAAVNHSPIEQFTPQTSDRSLSFTSKLKAMSINKLI